MRPLAVLGTTRVLQSYCDRVYQPNCQIVRANQQTQAIRAERSHDFTMARALSIMRVAILAFMLALSATAVSAQPETAGQTLAKLDKLSAENRQKVLIERARSEKEVTFYSSLQTADAELYMKAFNRRYPFIKVNIYRISGQKQVIMIQSEFNAGRHAFDITNASAAQAFGIKKTGALDPYQNPQRQYFSSAHKDKEGYFIPTYIVPVVLGYNTNMVKRNEAPKRYEDSRKIKTSGYPLSRV